MLFRSVEIFENDDQIGDWDMPMAFEKLHPGAIYLHKKTSYRCKELIANDNYLQSIVSKTELSEKNLRTKANVSTKPCITKPILEQKIFAIDVSLCEIDITNSIDSYFEFDIEHPKNNNDSNLELKNRDDKFESKFVKKSLDKAIQVKLPTSGLVFDLTPIKNSINQSPEKIGRAHV